MWKMTISRSAHVSSASTLASTVFQDPIVSDAGLLRYPQFCSAPLEEGHGRLPGSISAQMFSASKHPFPKPNTVLCMHYLMDFLDYRKKEQTTISQEDYLIHNQQVPQL